MIVKGSMNYTYSGRRKKSYTKTKKVKETKNLGRDTSKSRDIMDYPSASSNTSNGHVPTKVDEQYAQERRNVSSNYTIAPAYNKGAYQVISKDNTKDIGK